ncbi:LOB domain-containing protein 6-like [Solanum verrucosum]|uniref:LOB domain-containing protein 6-like n=1 Tax=Solanum verrucosum TaxID=315347 RepID=UPI0020D0AE2C|nr:LOB domain-containing protein 6-like [Solanum verrucosum]
MTNIVNHNQNVSSALTPPPPSLNTTTTITRVTSRGCGGGNGSQACAACKYQRRRCAPDCLLAPYFPVERNKEFLNAHKLFGVSNLLKLLRNVEPFQRDNAMKALIFEANIRAGDPVGGCYRIIMNLQRLINLYETELQFTYNEIFRVQAVDIQNNINTNTNSVQVNNSIGGGFNRSCIGHSSKGINSIGRFGESSKKVNSMDGFGESTKGINSIGRFGDESLNSQIIKVELLDDFNNEFEMKADEFETKVAISSSKGKQSVVENGDFKPYFGNNCKGKGVASDDDKVVSNTRVN